MAGKDKQQEPMENDQTRTSHANHYNKKMEVDRPHIEKEEHYCDTSCPGMESPGKQKKRKTKKHLEKRSLARGKEDWKDLEEGKSTAKDRIQEVERPRSRPMTYAPLPRGRIKCEDPTVQFILKPWLCSTTCTT